MAQVFSSMVRCRFGSGGEEERLVSEPGSRRGFSILPLKLWFGVFVNVFWEYCDLEEELVKVLEEELSPLLLKLYKDSPTSEVFKPSGFIKLL